VSQDEWGFVIVDVTAGAEPSMHLRRVSLGNETTPRDNEVRDEISIRVHDEAPMRPVARAPRGRVTSACSTMLASDFVDPDGDLHGATRWQVADRCDELTWAPVVDRIRSFQNVYGGADTQAADDLSDEPIMLDGETPLVEGDYRCWRVRHRDRGLAWSEWSEPVAFVIDEDGATPAMGCDDPSTLEPPPRIDAAMDPDVGAVDDAGADAGPTSVGGSCGCRTHRQAHASRLALMLGVGLVAGALRRRRTPPP
jgi:MYXO-CTERM domain-containing protein